MTDMPPSAARDMARRLLAQETKGADQPDAVVAGIQQLCTRVSDNLRQSVGDDGYNALLARVLRRTEPEHPVLTDIRRVADSGIYLDRVSAGVESHGVAAVQAAIESLLATLIDVLAGLIGADMVLNLLDHDDPSSHTPRSRQPQ
jgi:hypothetical protein